MLWGDTDHGIITTYAVLAENPSDTALLKPAVREHRRMFRKRLKAVAGDRGFYSQANEDWLKSSGLKRSRLRGSPGVNIWVGQGIFAHNLWQSSRIG